MNLCMKVFMELCLLNTVFMEGQSSTLIRWPLKRVRNDISHLHFTIGDKKNSTSSTLDSIIPKVCLPLAGGTAVFRDLKHISLVIRTTMPWRLLSELRLQN